MILEPQLKACLFCGEEFPAIKRKKYCKKYCASKAWSNAHREEVIARDKRAYAKLLEDPRKGMLQRTKARAKKRGIPFGLTSEDIVIPEFCPVLGILLSPNKIRGDNSPSLDRIVTELGYVKGNVAVISWRANKIKSNATLEELEKIVKWLRRQK